MTGNIANKNNDPELIQRFKNGDVTGFNEIVRKYQQQVYWVIRKIVQDHDEADDITQEVFIKVHSALKDFREESNLFTWLYRIATNYSINHLRKARVRNTVSVELVVEPIESKDKGADEAIDDESRRRYLEEAIETLPAQQRAVFNMRYYDRLPYDEIAEILGRSTGGIKANYFHAVKKIGEYVKGKIEY
ncbi:MAG: RNA polymerase sigma factor [Ignavibacteria bacterium]|nr:RNA polymerase sigma factor [Ignavibacteria bacterium]HRJ86463.1 RNA polymerase sigma factor [Ignavibacteria bacterium]